MMPEMLGARDFADFYKLQGKYVEVLFDDKSCKLCEICQRPPFGIQHSCFQIRVVIS